MIQLSHYEKYLHDVWALIPVTMSLKFLIAPITLRHTIAKHQKPWRGGYFCKFWVGMCHWDPGTLEPWNPGTRSLYQS